MASKFRREVKNVVYNYTDAETKVREATSNDPWGPSSALMAELADYTYHIQAYGLVMGMLWKRLNDHGKNWRHVYKKVSTRQLTPSQKLVLQRYLKELHGNYWSDGIEGSYMYMYDLQSLVVLEYLIRNGSERVVQQCKDNIFSIQTLKDFQYIDKEGKDQGSNIRDKAKQLAALLKDDRKLKDERVRAHQARDRLKAESSQQTPSPKLRKKVQFDETHSTSSASESTDGRIVKNAQNVEQARPTDTSEEELQLKLAIQLSKQHADEDEKLRKQEEESLKAAIALSEAESSEVHDDKKEEAEQGEDLLLELSAADPWSSMPAEPPPSYDLVTGVPVSDPWTSLPPTAEADTEQMDPFATPWDASTSSMMKETSTSDPWSADIIIPPIDPVIDLSGPLAPNPSGTISVEPSVSLNPFDLTGLETALHSGGNSSPKPPRVEDQFLGQNAALVDLDLLSGPATNVPSGSSPNNPFGVSGSGSLQQQNPFDATKAPAPTLNQLAAASQAGFGNEDLLPPPLIPAGSESPQLQPAHSTQPYPNGNQTFNPFS